MEKIKVTEKDILQGEIKRLTLENERLKAENEKLKNQLSIINGPKL
jgi:regulator of replication initiation timing